MPVYDSIATAVWKSLQLSGVAPNALSPGWDRLFTDPRLRLV
jgi:hypothetical protein